MHITILKTSGAIKVKVYVQELSESQLRKKNSTSFSLSVTQHHTVLKLFQK
jgi:hypothetical protein